MSNEKEISALVTLLEEAYPNREKLSDGAIRLYYEVLKDLPFEVLEAAAKDHLSSNKWFPTIAELREKSISYSMPQLQSGMEAWADVQKEIRRVGYMGKPQFENPLTQRMVDALGWRYLCHSEDGMADRAHFLKGYDQVAVREQHDRVLMPEIKKLAKQLSAGRQNNDANR